MRRAVVASLWTCALLLACGGPAVRSEPRPLRPVAEPSAPGEPAEPSTPPAGGPAGTSAAGDDDTPPVAAGPADTADTSPAAAAPTPSPDRQPLARLSVRETRGRFRDDEPYRRGVPLARGDCHELAELRAWRAADGAPLPCQLRALSRWPDGSLRWVLVDGRIDLAGKDAVTVVVGRAPDIPAGIDPWTVAADVSGGVTVTDGDLSWRLLGPGLRGDEVLGLRGSLTDRFGHVYRFTLDAEPLTILERGPLRFVAAITGSHRRVDDDGLPIAFHSVTAHVHLLAGRRTAQVEWTLENGPLHDPPGRLAFRSYALDIDPPADVDTLHLPGRTVREASAVELLQLADGPRLTLAGRRETAPRNGPLWLGVGGAAGDLAVWREDAAGEHPAAVAWDGRGPIEMRCLPALEGREYWLDDATRKTFRVHLVRDVGAAAPARMARLEDPAHATVEPLSLWTSEAWGDTGAWYQPSARELKRPLSPPADAPTGWADWGEAEARNTHQSGSPRNRLSVFLEALQSGRADLFRWARTRARHAMDRRPFHIQGFDADAFPRANLYEGVPHPNERPERRLGRSEMPGRFTEYKRGLPPDGHGYNGFDPEHMTLDDVYECYLLTGSWLARSALRSAGEAMLTWKELLPDGAIHSSRSFGWTLRALVQVHRATGEDRYLDAARRLVARADAERGHGAVKYLRSMPPDARHLPDRESDDPWMVAIALHGLAAYAIESGDPRVPPMLVDLSAFCLSAFRGNGFLPDLAIDGSPVQAQVSPLGVSSWVPGGLAAAALVTGDHRPVDAVLPYFRLLRRDHRQPIHYGGKDWHWWQTYLVSLERRHGRAALEAEG